MPRKTHRMLELEGKFGKLIDAIILEALNMDGSLTLAAYNLGVSKAVLSLWCWKLGIQKKTRWVQYKMTKEEA